MSEIPGQSGHALPDLQPPVCANSDQTYKVTMSQDRPALRIAFLLWGRMLTVCNGRTRLIS
jgi:hypothetical protein